MVYKRSYSSTKKFKQAIFHDGKIYSVGDVVIKRPEPVITEKTITKEVNEALKCVPTEIQPKKCVHSNISVDGLRIVNEQPKVQNKLPPQHIENRVETQKKVIKKMKKNLQTGGRIAII